MKLSKPFKTAKAKIVLIIVTGVLAFWAGHFIGNSHPKQNEENHSEQQHKAEVYTCSMHPQIKLPHPGQCPICAMDLIPLASNQDATHDGLPTIKLSQYAQKLAQVQTFKVQSSQDLNFNENSNQNWVGEVIWNESALKNETALFGGRIERLKVNYEGQGVKPGEVIAEIWSPELFALAEEWRQAQQSQNEILQNAVSQKLHLLGLEASDFKDLVQNQSERFVVKARQGGVVTHLNVRVGQYIKTGDELFKLASPKDLWVRLNVFEKDLPFINLGQIINLSIQNYTEKEIKAKVEYISPDLDPVRRTLEVRLSLNNPKGLFKPGMLVRAGAVTSKRSAKLVIPESAPLLTGKRALVYIEDSPGVYSAREVQLGSLHQGYYDVIAGLQEGERVVSRGAFKIDASMQLQGHPSMMYPQGTIAGGTHNHGQTQPPQLESPEPKNELVHVVSDPKVDKWLTQSYDLYIDLQRELAGDHIQKSIAAFKLLSQQLQKAPVSKNTELSQRIKKLNAEFLKMNQVDKIEEIRSVLSLISDLMIDLIKFYKPELRQNAVVYFCPMANNDKGANWLQVGGEVNNPYYGAMMLRCGEQKQTLVSKNTKTGVDSHEH
jgi:Cu(I)/Ag(I) efflux system membrane fusion protein